MPVALAGSPIDRAKRIQIADAVDEFASFIRDLSPNVSPQRPGGYEESWECSNCESAANTDAPLLPNRRTDARPRAGYCFPIPDPQCSLSLSSTNSSTETRPRAAAGPISVCSAAPWRELRLSPAKPETWA